MRGLSGHPPKERLYYIPRSMEVPPMNLQTQIFPTADQLLENVIRGAGCERNLAARGFLELIIYLRRVILQDAAVLIDTYASCSVWQHPVFTSQSFREFKASLISKMETTPSPTELLLQQSLPIISAQLKTLHNSLAMEMKGVLDVVRETQQISKQTHEDLSKLLSGGMEVRLIPRTSPQHQTDDTPQPQPPQDRKSVV